MVRNTASVVKEYIDSETGNPVRLIELECDGWKIGKVIGILHLQFFGSTADVRRT
jgi:hypothetical protein